MKNLPPVEHLREQARCVQEEYPELFDYLVHRDRATGELVRELMHAMPEMSTIPFISLPFVEATLEVVVQVEHCQVCRNEEMLWLLKGVQRAKLCQVCKHGIFLRRTGIGGLAG